MASLPSRTTASFDAIKPVSSLTLLDDEFNQLVGAAGILNGGTTGTKLLVKASDASDPPVDIDQTGAGILARWKSSGVSKLAIANSGQISSSVATGTSPLSVASTTVNTNLNADMVDGQHYTDIQTYVDGKKISFAASFTIVDPSTANTNASEFGSLLIPGGGSYTITKFKVFFKDGSHTSGGSLTFQVVLAGTGVISTAALKLDDTNNTINTVYSDDIGDTSVSENAILTPILSARSGTITEQGVSVIIEGYRTPF